MSNLIFDESTMLDGNIFKFEERLHSQVNKYIENGAILTTYFSQDENSSTVDRGLKDIDSLFGKNSPLRYSEINNFPLYGFGQSNPNNSDEQQIEDINVEGECIILPTTIVPKPMDFFIVKHLKMLALFQVTAVTYDSMKVDGFYKIQYRLQSTSQETIDNLRTQITGVYYTELNNIGTSMNPIISEDDYVYRNKLIQMCNIMINSYRGLFYNERHNCFLYHNEHDGLTYFDHCGNEFMARHALMNYRNSAKVIILNNKLDDRLFIKRYNNSIYNWIEMGAPDELLQKFYFSHIDASNYPTSSFNKWGEDDIQIIHPLSITESRISNKSIFDDNELNSFLDSVNIPNNVYEAVIWKFINKKDITIHDIPLTTANMLLNDMNDFHIYIYTPIIIYIIREVLRMG